jgi:predicted AAA+ superfamily ATPase
MERKIDKRLIKWKNRAARMPLLLHGARQVGKTYTALTFGKTYYKNTVYFNFEDSIDLPAIFERDLDPERIIRELSVKAGQSIFEGDTLIIFDEIQACERALTSLKYFCEKAPEYHVIAAGSLLGVALNREKYSFPVGKVEMLTLYPLDFEEFLWATENQGLCELIRECYQNFSQFSLHEMAMELYKTYLVVGGMPKAVSEYVEKHDYDFVLAVQKGLNDAYIADMAKYASSQETTRIMSAWGSVPAQLSKDNHKFQYKMIKSGARAYEYEMPLQWLQSAGIINRCVRVSEGKMPLSAYADNDTFKIYMVDTGLLCSKFGIAANMVISSPHSFDGFKGALAENYIMQALVTGGFMPYYWESNGKAELDFLFQDRQGNIIPLEAKSATNVRAKSLRRFIEMYNPPYAIRVSGKNFGFENMIKSVPLYAVFCHETIC